ncbi:MAG: Pyrimidine reductase family protein [Pseudoclavibacter caeni]
MSAGHDTAPDAFRPCGTAAPHETSNTRPAPAPVHDDPAEIVDVAGVALDDRALLHRHVFPAGLERPWVRTNMVTTIDGAVTRGGVSGPLGGPADHRLFDLLRRLADVVLIGAGTVRREGYGALRLDPTVAAWRSARGLAAQPAFAIVSGAARLAPDSAVFADAPRRPLVFVAADAPSARRAALDPVADVVVAGAHRVEIPALLAELDRRGLRRVHCEGGPTLLGALAAADAIDEMCVTLDATVLGGTGPRMVVSPGEHPRRMRMAGILRGRDALLLRWLRDRQPADGTRRR